MRIESEGIVLNLQKYTDNSYIAHVFSKNHGLISGLIRNKKNQSLSFGNYLIFKYVRKNVNNLGNFTVDKIENVSTEIFFTPLKLLMLNSALVLLGKSLPENEPNEKIFLSIQSLQSNLQKHNIENSIIHYVKFELFFLQEMGFGLNFESCPVHGKKEKFGYISPKIGRIISEKAGLPHKNKLFKLPKFFQNQATNLEDLLFCLKITQFFIQKRILIHKKLSSSRLILHQKILLYSE